MYKSRQFRFEKRFTLHCNSNSTMSITIVLRQYEAQQSAMNTGNYRLALDDDDYPSSHTDQEGLVRKFGTSLINMPLELQHEMRTLLIRPPQPVLFSNLQVLDNIVLQQTLSVVLKQCPQIRELCLVSTQPEQFCSWADLQCCHTLEQLCQVILHCMLAERMFPVHRPVKSRLKS